MFDIIDDTLEISVRHLVEFICRSGNLDNRFGGVTTSDAMEAGSRAHKKIQNSMGPDYRSEVPLKYTRDYERYRIVVEGRADGIFVENDITYIDEIKSTYRELKYINEPVYVHKAQAMCYAYFYGLSEDVFPESMGIRMTYMNLDTEEIRYFTETKSRQELEDWFKGIMDELIKWSDFLLDSRLERNASIKGLPFPFPYREGQRDLVVSVYRTIEQQRRLYIQAPTGVGKTIATVYPSVMAMGEGLVSKIFYLTAKTITRTVAAEAFSLLRGRGLKARTIVITAKEKLCPLMRGETAVANGDLSEETEAYAASEIMRPRSPECNPSACPRARGHFDRVNEAVYDLVTNEYVIDRETLERYAQKHCVCPFEMELDASYWVDAVICDYNYVFDPTVYLKRYFEGGGGDYVFLVDEAHNLVDRAMQMYSAELFKEDFLRIKKILAGAPKYIIRSLERCNHDLLELKKGHAGEYTVIENDDKFYVHLAALSEDMIRFMQTHRDYPEMKDLSEFFFEVNHYLNMHSVMEDDYVIYTENFDDGFMIRLYCVDPSANLRERMKNGRSAVFFSATLLPINYYKELISGDKEDYAIYAHSPFDTSKRLLIVGRDVTSRYTMRGPEMFGRIAGYIVKTAVAHPGNYLVFFSSYVFMSKNNIFYYLA